MRVLTVNDSTVLVELAGLDEVLALQASLTLEPLIGLEEVLPAAQTVMLRFDAARLSSEVIAQRLAARDLSQRRRTPGPLVEIPMRYDGEDLVEVARLSGLTVAEVVRRHQASEFTVAFCGFAPGFGYLVGGDPSLQVPRRATPRTQVPAGSVALGGGYCGVYPRATPGGWLIIGTTPLAMWDPDRVPPARLRPGMRVRFVEAASCAEAPPQALRAPPAESTRCSLITVVQAMLPVLVQDLGRPGHAAVGVGVSGAMDRKALQSANRAVGNPPDAPCLEVTLGSVVLGCSDATALALAGAPTPIKVQRASGEVFEGAFGAPLALRRGDRVTLGHPPRGLRTYIAVGGGFSVPRALGSASRDTLAGLGPAPAVKGSVLPVGRAAVAPLRRPSRRSAASVPPQPLPAPGDIVELDIVMGPRDDRFTEEAVALLRDQLWRVTPQSSRVGLRLQGAQALQRRSAAELPSEGLVSGAIQVPHDGQPVLLLADHPVTGGYPVIAVVAGHHLDLAGQVPPGAMIRFRVMAPPASTATPRAMDGA